MAGASEHEHSARTICPIERHRMISEAAYLRAEKRGFETGCVLDDWLCAEREVDAVIEACATLDKR